MTIGDALVEGAKKGLDESMVKRFTGHLILADASEKKTGVFFTNKSLKVLSDYPKIKEVLQEQEFIDDFLPLTRGVAMLLQGGDEDATFKMFFGVNFEEYQRMFLENVELVEGNLLQDGERGMLISDKTREQLYEFFGFWVMPEGVELNEDDLPLEAREQKDTLEIRRDLVFLGIGAENLESDIRLPVKGIFQFKSLNAVWHEMNFMDIESYRECFGYFTAKDQMVALSETQETALSTEEDDLFGAFDVVEDTELNTEQYDVEAMQEHTERIVTDVNLDEGAYNLIAVRLKPEISVPDGQARLEQVVKDAQLDLKILTWKKAAGEVAQFATMTQSALYVFVLFIFFVAVIIIMNTLSMAAIERTGEIGMMRAIGARKAFIRKMFFAETLLLSAIFGGLGIVIGIFVVWGIGAMNIATTGNEIMNLLFGSDTVQPVVNIAGIVSGVIQLAIVTLLAMVYPIRVATKITPLEAISRE